MAVSDTYAHRILNALLRGQAFVPPAGLWLSLHTGAPGKTGLLELSNAQVPAYARADAAAGGAISTAFDQPAGGLVLNAKVIAFPILAVVNAPNITLTHFGVWDAQTAGTFIFGEPLPQPVVFRSIDVLRIDVGALSIGVTT